MSPDPDYVTPDNVKPECRTSLSGSRRQGVGAEDIFFYTFISNTCFTILAFKDTSKEERR